jgi:predicted TIM-barrel fold metal-dependent hydrolase
VEEDWGFDDDHRIYATPLLVLFDPDLAVAELERVLNAGARAIALNTGPVLGHSPGDPKFDGFWGLLNEAKAPVCFHIDYFGYHDFFSAAWGELAEPVSEAQVNAFQWITCAGMRPMMDMVASLVMHNVFGKFPDVPILSVSNGSAWIKDLERLDAFASPDFPWPRDEAVWWPGGRLSAPPSEVIRQHLYVAPFVWDDMTEILEYVPAERVVMATDYPHPDGFAVAEEYLSLLTTVEPSVAQLITRDNFTRLLSLT